MDVDSRHSRPNKSARDHATTSSGHQQTSSKLMSTTVSSSSSSLDSNPNMRLGPVSQIPHTLKQEHKYNSSGSVKWKSKEQGQGNEAEEVNANDAFTALRAIGMPEEVTRESFVRLYLSSVPASASSSGKDKEREKGRPTRTRREKDNVAVPEKTKSFPWKDFLDTLAAQLVGRQEAARVRAILQASGGVGLDKEPSDRLASTHRILNATRCEWEVEHARVETLENRLKSLKVQLAERRRVLLLLGVLERRESVRVVRLGDNTGSANNQGRRGLGTLIGELRRESAIAVREVGCVLAEVSKQNQPRASARIPQTKPGGQAGGYRHTRDALAKLHALHVRLHAAYADIPNDGPTQPTSTELDERLDNALARLGVRPEEVLETRTKLETLARLRASRRLQYRSDRSSGTPEELEKALDAQVLALSDKRRLVAARIARVVGLGWVAEGCIDMVAAFRTETAPALRKMLVEESGRVEGYVDSLRQAIVSGTQRDGDAQSDGSFVCTVRATLGTTRVRVWDEVAERLGDAAMREAACAGWTAAFGGAGGAEVSNVRVDAERNAKLLERKARKAEHGFVIVGEVKGLLDSLKRIREISK